MLPDSPTHVIISDKRLIGEHTMSFPLIKELSRKTEIATQHCQQSNQQRQLAVNSSSRLSLHRPLGQSRAGRTRTHGGQSPQCSKAPTPSTPPLRGQQGMGWWLLPVLAEGHLFASLCLIVCLLVSPEPTRGTPALIFPSSRQSPGHGVGCTDLGNPLPSLEPFYLFFMVCEQLLLISMM